VRSAHYLGSGKANPKIKIPATNRANSEKIIGWPQKKYLEGRNLHILDIKVFRTYKIDNNLTHSTTVL